MTKNFVAMRYVNNSHAAFSVDWYIGKRCNFDCSYCVDYLHDNISKHPPLERCTALADTIYNTYGSNVMWSITGGEPTVIPWFHDVAQYIYEKPGGARDISITTNGSRTTKYFTETLYPYLHNITMSMHFEHIAHREDEYIEKILAIESWRKQWNKEQKEKDPEFNTNAGWAIGHRNKFFLARFMVYPGQFDRIKRMYDRFKDAGVEKVEFRYIRPMVGTANEQMPTKKLSTDYNHDTADNLKSLHEEGIELKSKITGGAFNTLEPGTTKQVFAGASTRNDGITDKQAPAYAPIDSKSPHTVKIVKKEDEWYSQEEKAQIREWYKGDPKKFLKMYFDDAGETTEDDYHYNQLNFERKNNFEGWTCWAGRAHMKITPSGDVYVGSCHVGGKLGNIFNLDDKFVLPEGPITCPKWRCTDNLDIRVPKAKKGYEHLVEPYVTKVATGL